MPITVEQFKVLRRRLKLTQMQLAHELGVHPMTVSKWERGAQPIPEPVARLVRMLSAARGRSK